MRVDLGRRDGVHGDAVLSQLHRHRARQLGHAGLGGVVAHQVLDAAEGVDRGHGDDAAAAALPHHLARRRLAGEEHAGEVHAQHALPLRLGVLEERRRVGDAGVGHHHVEPAELAHHALDEGVDLGRVADVEGHRQRLAAVPGDLTRRRFGAGGVDVTQRDRGALGREQLRGRAPDAARAARDRRDLPLEPHGIVSSSKCSVASCARRSATGGTRRERRR